MYQQDRFCCCARDKLTEEAELRKDVCGGAEYYHKQILMLLLIMPEAKILLDFLVMWAKTFSLALRYFELSPVSYGQESSIELAGHGGIVMQILKCAIG